MPRGRNRRSRKEDTHDRSPGQPARHSAGFTHLTAAGEYIHAPVRPGMEEAQAGAAPRQSYRADDLVILCKKGNADEALQQLRKIMGKLKLTVNEEKTRIYRVPEGEFDFL